MVEEVWEDLTVKCGVCRFLVYCSSTYQFECKLEGYENGADTLDKQSDEAYQRIVDSQSKETPAELKNPFDKQVGGSHYKKEGVPDVTEWCMRHEIPCAEFNVIKYTYRHKKKNGIEDLRKAKHYLEFIAFLEYGENL